MPSPISRAISEPLKTVELGRVNSLIIPVYKNAESLQQLLLEIDDIAAKLRDPLEVVFVIDGSPDPFGPNQDIRSV
jgi:hypothetical protein